MTALELATYIRYGLRKNPTTLPDSDLLPIVNMWIQSMSHYIVGVSEDFFGVVATTDLYEDQRQYQDPEDMIKMKYLEAKFDGSNWVRLDEFDINTYKRPTDEATTLANFNNLPGGCGFDRFGSGFTIYSGKINDVSGGLKLHLISYPGKLANLTDNTKDLSVAPDNTHSGFPREFHELLARRVRIDIKSGGDTPKGLTDDEQLFIKDFEDNMALIAGVNLDRTLLAKIPDTDNGFNY